MLQGVVRGVLFIALSIALMGCAPGVREADVEATVNARVAQTLSAVPSAEDTPLPLEAPPVEIPVAVGPDASPAMGECPIFPADDIWNTRVDSLPVDPNSDAYIASIGEDTALHPDFGSGMWEGSPIGIPHNVVDGSSFAPSEIEFYYPDESDPGPYPVPPDPLIEGGGDAHILIVDISACRLWEIYDAFPEGRDRWSAGSGAAWDLQGYALRPETWTSADAAGLPILPGLVRYDEVVAGEIHHALRFTADQTRQDYVWPARHYASDITSSGVPPMGHESRL